MRMGRPKAWLPFGNELMLPRVVRILAGEVSPVVVVAAPGQDLPPLPAAVEIVRDREEGRGPLEGLAAGLDALHGRADAVYLSACDAPFLRREFIRRMIALIGDSWICAPRLAGFHEPLAAVYRIEVLDAVQRLLRENRFGPTGLFDSAPTRSVDPSELSDVDPTLESLRNLNTREDYEAALRDLAAMME
jgi:molybdopterin-guanine dinucleotide biosynthesis protein A